jgi:hypothetical protein
MKGTRDKHENREMRKQRSMEDSEATTLTEMLVRQNKEE